MRLDRLLPIRVLKFDWEKAPPKTGPLPFPKSRQGWVSIGTQAHLIPTGATVKAQAPLGDGTRGVLTLWCPWWPAIGGDAGITTIQIAFLDDTVPDPVPPLFAMNPVNCHAGRMSVVTNDAQTSPVVAGFIAGTFNAMLGIAGLDSKFTAMGGLIQANLALPNLGDGTVALVSPKPYRTCEFSSATGAWGALAVNGVVKNEARVRPELFAGCRPAPWLVVGDEFEGLGEEMPIIG